MTLDIRPALIDGFEAIEAQFDNIKWYIWYGNAFEAKKPVGYMMMFVVLD